MADLTTWEADRGGYFQGTATLGQVIGRAVDWMLAKIGKLPQLPKLEPNKDHWSTWPEGPPMTITEALRKQMVQDGRLPDVDYRGNHEDLAQMHVMSGTHVFVEMLDTDRRTRHRCKHLGTLLIASREGWEASLRVSG